jgi:type III restriction enzyme
LVVRPDQGHGDDNVLNLIIELTWQKRKDKEIKVSTARDMWVPTINNHGGFGRWAFLEIRDPWNAQNEVRAALEDVAMPEETDS